MQNVTPTLLAFVTVLCTVRAQTYPAEYPFENEKSVVPVPMPASPSFTYDDADPGGYYYTYFFLLTEIPEFPYCFAGMGAEYYSAVIRREVEDRPPRLPFDTYNCTLKGSDFVLSAASFPGDIVGSQVSCEKEGECCAQWYGTPAFWDGAEDTWMKDFMNAEWEAGVCSGDWTEQIYCLLMDQSATTNCYEYVVDQSARINDRLSGCYDQRYYNVAQCPVYMETGLKYEGNEPPAYFEESSANELNAHTSMWINPDKMCLPYSYYYPEFAKSGSESSSESASTDNEKASEPSESSAAAVLSFASVIFLIFS